MGSLLDGLREALGLLVRLDPEVFSIAWLSLRLSLASTACATLVGVPLGTGLALSDFRGRRAVVGALHALLALPTVVVGLLFYAILSRSGPLGGLGLLYSPWAILLGQFVLAVPIVAAMTLGLVEGADPRVIPTARTLGASALRARLTLLHELRWGLLSAVLTAFGRVFAEVGVAMMLGGNIRGVTRTLTTAIALQTSRGEFALGLALGLILMSVALAVAGAAVLLPRRREVRHGG
jgi:tungstate transport system permease protein